MTVVGYKKTAASHAVLKISVKFAGGLEMKSGKMY